MSFVTKRPYDPRPKRVLVTGSRAWTDRDAVWMALNKACDSPGTIVVHGACPTGADYWAHQWCLTQPDIIEEPHPANWNRYGRAAGPRRNREMVNLGADVCLAFPLPDSRGTVDCITRAKLMGIPVQIIK